MKAKGFAWVGMTLLWIGVIVSFSFSVQPAVAQSPDTDALNHLFLPSIMRAGPPPYFGLAMALNLPEDLDTLRVTWYYNWTDQPGIVNGVEGIAMAYSGLRGRIPADTEGWVLVFNEPNNPAPNGCGLTPADAAVRYIQLRRDLPRAKLVVGGWSVFAQDWIKSFVAELRRAGEPLPQYWHVHAYTEEWITPNVARAFLLSYHELTGGTYWITEYGSPAGSLEDFKTMTDWFQQQPWIERVAAYTNRQPAGVGWAIGEGVELIGSGDEPTAIGTYFQEAAQKKR